MRLIYSDLNVLGYETPIHGPYVSEAPTCYLHTPEGQKHTDVLTEGEMGKDRADKKEDTDVMEPKGHSTYSKTGTNIYQEATQNQGLRKKSTSDMKMQRYISFRVIRM